MPRPGDRDFIKERYWRRAFADWKISALTAAEYCRRHSIKYWQFLDWQKTLRKRDIEIERRTAELRKEHKQKLADCKKTQAVKTEETKSACAPDFVPVSVTEKVPNSTVQSNGLEIVLPCGTSIRLHDRGSLDLFSAALAVLENR
jgi:hypothetical protein